MNNWGYNFVYRKDAESMNKGYIIAIVYNAKNEITGYVVMYFVNGVPMQKIIDKQQLIAGVKANKVEIGNAKLINNGFAGTLYALTDLAGLIYDKGKFSLKQRSGILAVILFKDRGNVLITALGMHDGVYAMEFKTVPANTINKIQLINRDKSTGKIELNIIEEPKAKPVQKAMPKPVTQANITNTPATIVAERKPEKTAEEKQKEERDMIERLKAMMEHKENEAKRRRLDELEAKMLNLDEDWRLQDFKDYMDLKGFTYEYVCTNKSEIEAKKRSKDRPAPRYEIRNIDTRCDKYRAIKEYKLGQYKILTPGQCYTELKILILNPDMKEVSSSLDYDIPGLSLDKLIFMRDFTGGDSYSTGSLSRILPKPATGTRHKIKELVLMVCKESKDDDGRFNLLDNLEIDKLTIQHKCKGTVFTCEIHDGNDCIVRDIEVVDSDNSRLAFRDAFKTSEFLADREKLDLHSNVISIKESFTGSNVPKVINIYNQDLELIDSFNFSTVEELNVLYTEPGKPNKFYCYTPQSVSGFNSTKITSVNIPYNKDDDSTRLALTVGGFQECLFLQEFNIDPRFERVYIQTNSFHKTPSLKEFIFRAGYAIQGNWVDSISIPNTFNDSGANLIFEEGFEWTGFTLNMLDGTPSHEIKADIIKLPLQDEVVANAIIYNNNKKRGDYARTPDSLSKYEMPKPFSETDPEILKRIKCLPVGFGALQTSFDSKYLIDDVVLSKYGFCNIEETSNIRLYNDNIRKKGILPFGYKDIILRPNVARVFEYNDNGKCTMQKWAVANLERLRNLILWTDCIESIETSAIYNCTLLTNLAIGPSVKEIAPVAFNTIKSIEKVNVFIVAGSYADKYFSKRADKFNIVYVESLQDAEERIFAQTANPRMITKYKLFAMNSEFGDVLKRTDEDIWEKTKLIYSNWFTNTSYSMNNTLDSSKFKLIRKLDNTTALLGVIRKCREELYYNNYKSSRKLQGADGVTCYANERVVFNSLCNLITTTSNMSHIINNQVLMDMISGTGGEIYESSGYGSFASLTDNIYKNLFPKYARLPYVGSVSEYSLPETRFKLKSNFGYYAKCDIIYASSLTDSALVSVEIDSDSDYFRSGGGYGELIAHVDMRSSDTPLLLVIVKEGEIVYVTECNTNYMIRQFGRQLKYLKLLGIPDIFKRMAQNTDIDLSHGDNKNLMQPGFSLFDILDTGDVMSIQGEYDNRSKDSLLDITFSIQGHKLQDFSSRIGVRSLAMHLWANTLIIGMDPKNNVLDLDNKYDSQGTECGILLYDIISQRVIVCNQRRTVNKSTITTNGIGVSTIVEKLPLAEAYVKYKDWFKYMHQMFYVSDVPNDDFRSYTLNTVEKVINGLADKNTLPDIRPYKDESELDINKSELLSLGEKLANLGYSGYGFTLEMLLCALKCSIFEYEPGEFDYDDITLNERFEMVLYGELDGTNLELIEHNTYGNRDEPQPYRVLIVDAKTNQASVMYNGWTEIQGFMQTVYAGYKNVKDNDLSLKYANKITDITEDGSNYFIMCEVVLRGCRQKLHNGFDDRYVAAMAIDRRNLDYYILLKSRRGIIPMYRFTKFEHMKYFIDRAGRYVDSPEYVDELYDCNTTMYKPERSGKLPSQINYECRADEMRNLIMSGYTGTDDLILSPEIKESLKLLAKQKPV